MLKNICRSLAANMTIGNRDCVIIHSWLTLIADKK